MKENLDSTTSSIGDALWELYDLCDQYWKDDAVPLLRKKLQCIEESGKSIDIQSCFHSFDRGCDVEWNDLFFFEVENFLWHRASLLEDEICSFMEGKGLQFPSFHKPFNGNGFQIVVSNENEKLSITIKDCSKAVSFINWAKNISEINQDNITLLVVAAILSKPVIFTAAIIDEKPIDDYD